MAYKIQGWARKRAPQAFTLIELLVATAVLSIIVLILAQIVSMTSQAIDLSNRKLDSAAQARLFFDRLAADLAARPVRTDLGIALNVVKGNDSIQFYTTADGYGATSPSVRDISWVSYSIADPPTPNTGPLCLIREADGVDWRLGGGQQTVSFLAPPFTPPTVRAAVPANCDILAPGIFRLEICYLMSTGANAGQFSTSPGTDKYSALVIGVAVLDSKSLVLLTDAQVVALSGYLNDADNGNDPLTVWSSQIKDPNFAPGIPRKVVQDIRFYQRTLYVP